MSAGWRTGRGAWSIVWEGSWTCSWTPSTKPISPRLDGMGPACGLTSCVRVEEEEDATAYVEAITDWSGRSGKERVLGESGLDISSLHLARVRGGTPASN